MGVGKRYERKEVSATEDDVEMSCRLLRVDVENLSDFPEVWQAIGLEGEWQKLGKGVLTGGTGRETIPTDMLLL